MEIIYYVFLPYINGRYIMPCLYLVFVVFFHGRIINGFKNLAVEPHQEILFIIFLIAITVITIMTAWKKLSLIPILGMACCLYLMIEIPTRSWIVFFGWMAFGLVIYFSYGYFKSKLAARIDHVSANR